MVEALEPLLDVRGLRTYFYTDAGVVKAVDGADLSVYKGKCLGLVGESGCGKSMIARSIMQIVPRPSGKIVEGEIIYHREGSPIDLAKLDPNSRAMRLIRGRDISMIFQEPMNSLSPVHSIGDQITEGIIQHQRLKKREATERAVELLHRVRIPRAREIAREYPHQLSGGMRQRAMIALALACNPSLLIADEPTTALDVTVQAQILELLKELQEDFDMGLLLITHDLGVVAETADFVAVVYLGKVVEYGNVVDVFKDPRHPYTRALFDSVPTLEKEKSLTPIKGFVPDPYSVVKGCAFRDRCSERFAKCDSDEVPEMIHVAGSHAARCYLYEERGGESRNA